MHCMERRQRRPMRIRNTEPLGARQVYMRTHAHSTHTDTYTLACTDALLYALFRKAHAGICLSLSVCVRVCALGSCLCVHTSSDSASLSAARTYGVKVDGGQGELP
jgi:hypothetical protein